MHLLSLRKPVQDKFLRILKFVSKLIKTPAQKSHTVTYLKYRAVNPNSIFADPAGFLNSIRTGSTDPDPQPCLISVK